MKRTFLCLASWISAVLPSTASPENPLIPDTWFHELTATDGSTQQCIIFTTVPGVEYTFEHSDALGEWTEVGETYGLGHQFAAAMRETAPPPPPPDPGNPPEPGSALTCASITIQASSGAAGGTVVSWASLDHGNAVRHLIAGSIASAWDTVPLFADSQGGHHFFISHPTGATDPPEQTEILGAADAAMIADLEAAWADFNTALITSLETARNTLPPPPPAPDSKGFWRIKADWSLDSDSDGILDHAEFALAAAQAAGTDGLAGSAFNADTNGDGIPDGQQLDSDGDSIPDALDIAPSDSLVAYETVALPRYAMFTFADRHELPYEYQGIGRALAINDRGTVLFPDRVWKGGEFHNLTTEGPGVLFQGEENARLLAHAMNDLDQIIGSGSVDYIAEGPFETMCHWADTAAEPDQVLTVAGSVTTYAEFPGHRHSRHLGNDGGFYSQSLSIDYSQPEPTKAYLGWEKWTLPSGANPLASTPAAAFSKATGPGGIIWDSRYDGPGGAWSSSSITSPFTAAIPVNDPNHIHQSPNGNLIATSALADAPTMVRKDGQWEKSPLLEHALDIAAHGTAIGKSVPAKGVKPAILLNGKWTELERAAPGIPERWKTIPHVYLSDTSPGGWILAHDRPGDPEMPDDLSAALLPLRIKGRYTDSSNSVTETAVGVDDFSIGSSNPDLHPENLTPVSDRIWIMVPSADSAAAKEIVIDAPIHESAPVTLSADTIRFDGEEEIIVTARGQSIQVKAHDSAVSGAETLMDVKMGNTASVSRPVGFKVMKERRIKVVVWMVSSDRNAPGITAGQPGYVAPGAPDFDATEEELEKYLDDIFKPQVNLSFDCEYRPVTVSFDTGTGADFGLPADQFNPGNLILDTGIVPGKEFDAMRNAAYDSTASVNLYLLGDIFIIKTHIPSSTRTPYVAGLGMAKREERMAIVPTFSHDLTRLLDTVGHEIGHIVVGLGHPNQKDGAAPLPDTNHPKRLMCSGGKRRRDGTSRLLTKGEWDAAEKWLAEEFERIRQLSTP